MTTNAFLSPVFNGIQVLDSNSNIVSGAKIRSYLAGTTTPTPTYTTYVGDVPLPNPVIADSAGRFPSIYLGKGIATDLILMDANNVVLDSKFNLVGINDFSNLVQNPGSVTSVDVSGGTTGLTFTGGPVTTAATILAGGVLNPQNGGTGQTSLSAAFNGGSPLTTKGDLLSYGTTGTRLPIGGDGQILTANSSATLGVSWQSTAAATSAVRQVKTGWIGTSVITTAPTNTNSMGWITFPNTGAPTTGQGLQLFSQTMTLRDVYSHVAINFDCTFTNHAYPRPYLPVPSPYVVVVMFRDSTPFYVEMFTLPSPIFVDNTTGHQTYETQDGGGNPIYPTNSSYIQRVPIHVSCVDIATNTTAPVAYSARIGIGWNGATYTGSTPSFWGMLSYGPTATFNWDLNWVSSTWGGINQSQYCIQEIVDV